jgi:RNA polymerase sigma factor (TIGR02999 family)
MNPTDDPANPDRTVPDSADPGVLIERLYGELRDLAAAYLRRERADHTLQPTALVHEAWVRLAEHRRGFADAPCFHAAAAVAMRRVLVDHARRRAAHKRVGVAERVTLDPGLLVDDGMDVDVLELDHLLSELGRIDPRKARVVELKFFTGLGNEACAAALGIARTTVAEDWAVARAWLSARLSDRVRR